MRLAALWMLMCTAWAVQAGPIGAAYEWDTPLYFEQFDPAQKPWQPGQALNVEEVFKNYQYFEIRFLKQGTEIQVNRYIRNQRESSERYFIQLDGTLERVAP